MFDVRHTDNEGNLDLEKINKLLKQVEEIKQKKTQKRKLPKGTITFRDVKRIQEEKIKNETRKLEKELEQKILEQKEIEKKLRLNRLKIQKELEEARRGENKIIQLGVEMNSNEVPIIYKIETSPFKNTREDFPIKDEFILREDDWKNEIKERNKKEKSFSWMEVLSNILPNPSQIPKPKTFYALSESLKLPITGSLLVPKRTLYSFAVVSSFIFLVVFGIGFIKKGMEVKQSVLGISQTAYANLSKAKDEILKNNFKDSSFQFQEAYANFENISNEVSSLGNIFVESSQFLPYISKLSSGKYLAEAGKNISQIGILSGEIMKVLERIENPLNTSEGDSTSFLKIFQDTSKNSEEILNLLEKTEKDLKKVNIDDIPEEQRTKFVELKDKLPEMKNFIKGFLDNSQIFMDILGGNGPRKYLFLFQNNQEMRATGGFIGSYGVLDIFNGRINKFFIDGIFNPDGQLREKVIPPTPIQKISAAWSLHDSNWFPDFPVSAEKAIWFYEKTGGPTVDGIITMTPDVMQKLLEISGPIDMKEYGVIIDKDNFVEKIQNEVEVEYDKELNQPKKILADLAPKILDAIFNSKKLSTVIKTLDILMESLEEKQILLYSRNYEIEKKIIEEGWSGQIISTDKDYLSVINSNINGYKTDGVIDEIIEHSVEIQEDGSITDSVIITRKHTGGDKDYEWLNKVNANYMRVYVPKGSILLSAEGQTREINTPPLDYKSLKFKHDPQVEAEEESMEIDEKSGTRIYEDADKTVFANWVYVSPKEEVKIKYKYLLPFKISMNESDKPADTYSLLVQKQSGSLGSKLISKIFYPERFDLIWRYPENLDNDSEKLELEINLRKDRFIGAVFSNKKR